MKRTLATLGVVGLGLISLTAPAIAASDRIIVCHGEEGVWSPLEFDVNGIGGHRQHEEDIIPPTPKAPEGKNWNNAGKITYIAHCAELPAGETPPVVTPPVVEVPPVVVPPIEIPPVVVPPVVVEPPAVTPVVEQPTLTPDPVSEVPVVAPETPAVLTPVVEQPAVVAPAAGAVAAPAQPAAAAQPAARTGVPATASTSLGTNQGYNAQTAVGGAEGSPAWLGGLGALAAAGAAVAVRRRSGATS